MTFSREQQGFYCWSIDALPTADWLLLAGKVPAGLFFGEGRGSGRPITTRKSGIRLAAASCIYLIKLTQGHFFEPNMPQI